LALLSSCSETYLALESIIIFRKPWDDSITVDRRRLGVLVALWMTDDFSQGSVFDDVRLTMLGAQSS
jgi:hypothetical protein